MPAINKSKEAILQRMYSHAHQFWGIKDIHELDTVVRLLIEGLASLMYDTGQNVQDSGIRILESIASALTPGVLIAVRPAHAIMQLMPVEPFLFVNDHTLLHDKSPSQELLKQGIRTIPFSPVSKVRLVSGSVKYLVCERMLYDTGNGYEKKLLATAHTLDERINQSLWIGIDMHKEVSSLKHVSFYLDFPHADNRHEKYSLLPYTKWSMDGIPVETSPGLPVWDDEDRHGKIPVFAKYDLLNRIDRDILDFYRLQFQTVTGDTHLQEKQKATFPQEIREVYPEHVTDTLEPCYWIKVVFPPHIPAINIHDATVDMNAFPVANKVLHSVTSPPNNITGIIPMRTGTGEFFLSVDKVEDSHGYQYHAIPYETGKDTETGIYTVKEGGLERFDSRELKDYFERLLDLMHSESSVFRSMNMDNIRGIINDLQKNMTDIENKFRNSKMTLMEKPRYLLLNTLNEKDLVFIRYRTTHCEQANGIRSGKIFAPAVSIPVVENSCKLLKMSSGGKSAPSVTGRLNAYRYALTSHDQLFTHADISNFCEYELGEKISKVEVCRGIAVSPKPKEGLVRTIDIHLTPSTGCESIVAEMQTELLTRLSQKSPDSYNFRISIKKNQYK